MFGFVPGWLPDLVGRVVMVAALVEGKVDALLMNLSAELQSTHAGKPVLSNIRTIRARLDQIEAQFPDLAESTRLLLVDVERALKRRNAVVHSLWPDNSQDVARGWRNLPPNQRAESEAGHAQVWTDWIEMDSARFADLFGELVDLVDRLVDAIARCGPVGATAP